MSTNDTQKVKKITKSLNFDPVKDTSSTSKWRANMTVIASPFSIAVKSREEVNLYYKALGVATFQGS